MTSKTVGRQTVVAACTETVNPEEAGSEKEGSIEEGFPPFKTIERGTRKLTKDFTEYNAVCVLEARYAVTFGEINRMKSRAVLLIGKETKAYSAERAGMTAAPTAAATILGCRPKK